MPLTTVPAEKSRLAPLVSAQEPVKVKDHFVGGLRNLGSSGARFGGL